MRRKDNVYDTHRPLSADAILLIGKILPIVLHLRSPTLVVSINISMLATAVLACTCMA